MSALKKSCGVLALLPCIAIASNAHAQATVRATGSFEEIKAVSESKDETTLRLQTGGAFAAGNTQSVAVNAAARFVLRRGIHQLTIDGAANYGVAWNVPTTTPLPADPMRVQTPIQENFLLKGRYDIFFTPNDAIFFAPQAFRDRLAGFNSRLSFQVGYLRNWVNVADKRKFWTEIGADLNYENTDKPAPGQATNERFIGAARLFVGFEEKANKAFNFNIGAEGILDVVRPSNFRINGTMGISSKLIEDALSIGFSLTGRYVNEPIPLQEADNTMNPVVPLVERQRFDLTSMITVVYTYTPPKPPKPTTTTEAGNTTTTAPNGTTTTTTPAGNTTTTAPSGTTTTTTPSGTTTTTTPAGTTTTTTPAGTTTTTTPSGTTTTTSPTPSGTTTTTTQPSGATTTQPTPAPR